MEDSFSVYFDIPSTDLDELDVLLKCLSLLLQRASVKQLNVIQILETLDAPVADNVQVY